MVSLDTEERDEDDVSFVSASEHGNGDDDADSEGVDRPPVHPVTCMQGAFEESIMETMGHRQDSISSTSSMDTLDPKARRQRLLEGDYDGPRSSRGTKEPGAKYHKLWKLMAQISFGVHLLHQQLAKSDEEVVKIMQSHVDELDTFLEKTTEDFDLAIADINERINYLKLPLEHVNIFDIMLDDKPFRTSIIEGNEKIERIVERTARAMTDALDDVNVGIQATAELAKYLDNIGEKWTHGDEGLRNIYKAMHANVEGWYSCLGSLQLKGNTLGGSLVQLGGILNEMSKRAGVASRRSLSTQTADANSRASPRLRSSPPTSRYSPTHTPNKPLPQDPDVLAPIQTTLPRRDAVPLQLRYQYPRKQPKPPTAEERAINGLAHAHDHSGRPPTVNAAKSSHALGTPTQQPANSKKSRAPGRLHPNNSSKSLESMSLRPSTQPADRYTAPPAPVDSAHGSGSSPPTNNMSGPTYQRTPSGSRTAPYLSNASQASLAISAKSGRSGMTSKLLGNASCPAPAVPSGRNAVNIGTPVKKSSSLSSLKKLFQRKQSSKEKQPQLGQVNEDRIYPR